MKKRTICHHCNDYQIIKDLGAGVIAYQKPMVVVMLPVYVNREVDGVRRWLRVGLFCPRCHYFEYYEGAFKPGRHAV